MVDAPPGSIDSIAVSVEISFSERPSRMPPPTPAPTVTAPKTAAGIRVPAISPRETPTIGIAARMPMMPRPKRR